LKGSDLRTALFHRYHLPLPCVRMPLVLISTQEGINVEDPEDFELPPLNIPKKEGSPCPFCGEPTLFFDGDYVCLDCGDSPYGPVTG